MEGKKKILWNGPRGQGGTVPGKGGSLSLGNTFYYESREIVKKMWLCREKRVRDKGKKKYESFRLAGAASSLVPGKKKGLKHRGGEGENLHVPARNCKG